LPFILEKGGDEMSILELIQEAEAKGEKLKLEATEKVTKMLEDAQREGETEGKKIVEEAEVEAKQIALDTENQIKMMQEKILKENEEKDQTLAEKVNSRFDEAVNFIVGKVLML
jgi:V/A-type H+-transporting ATPase subunit G/H